MQINILTQYSVLAHGPSKFNTANFKKDNTYTYFITVVPICTKPVFLTLWTTDSCQPGKIIKNHQYKIRLLEYYVVQMFRWSSYTIEAADCFEMSVHLHQTPRCQSQRTANFRAASVRNLNPKNFNTRCSNIKKKISVNYQKLQKIFKSIYQFVLAASMFVSERKFT
jgi:hypothetical protein